MQSAQTPDRCQLRQTVASVHSSIALPRQSFIDTCYVYTYNVSMNITLSVDDAIVRRARRHAEAIGTSVNQLVRDYLEQLAGKRSREADLEEWTRLSNPPQGNSRGWKFNRDEIHERR